MVLKSVRPNLPQIRQLFAQWFIHLKHFAMPWFNLAEHIAHNKNNTVVEQHKTYRYLKETNHQNKKNETAFQRKSIVKSDKFVGVVLVSSLKLSFTMLGGGRACRFCLQNRLKQTFLKASVCFPLKNRTIQRKFDTCVIKPLFKTNTYVIPKHARFYYPFNVTRFNSSDNMYKWQPGFCHTNQTC